MYDYIYLEKVLNALWWLKENNPLHADIDVNDKWLVQAMANDNDLFTGIVDQSNANYTNTDSALHTQDLHNYWQLPLFSGELRPWSSNVLTQEAYYSNFKITAD